MAYSLRTYLPFYRRNLKVALPIVFSQLGGALVQLVDTLMVGRIGTVPLAAVSFATSVFIIGFVFSIGILMQLSGKSFLFDADIRQLLFRFRRCFNITGTRFFFCLLFFSLYLFP